MGEVRAFLALGMPTDEAAIDGPMEIPHDSIHCSEVNFRWVVVKLAETRT
jgi:hypothetical protein